jgi:uncharacterized protein (DUF1800 family)
MGFLAPVPARSFTPYAASHLLWRAGFGGTWEEAEELSSRGLDAAVDALVDYTPSGDHFVAPEAIRTPPESPHAFEARLKAIEDEDIRQKERQEYYRVENDLIRDLQAWWLSRMLASAPLPGKIPPLEEKLTLFWHSHFASGFPDKIRHTYPLWRQNETFRSLAIKPFPEQLKALIQDPAMLVWLDNASSNRGNPNENFARELMELFTLGVGHYSEADVKEAARALTGYSVEREDWSFRFRESAHDPEEKTFLGKSGPWGGDDVIDILCAQTAAADFMAGKFLRFFVCTAPDPEMIAAVADLYRSNGYDLKSLLHTLFRSELFYSERAMNSVVKSPVVLSVGALKSLQAPLPEADLLLGALQVMGQELFFPPNVNGWPGGADWINSNTLLVRYNFANFLMHGVSPDAFKTQDRKMIDRTASRREFIATERSAAVDWQPRAQIEESGAARRMLSARDVVDYFLREFLQRKPARDLRDNLIRLAETDGAGGTRSMNVRDKDFDERARGLVHLIMSSPDYQLC